MARVWEGYISSVDSRVDFITFDGVRIGGTVHVINGRDVEHTFYRVSDGRVVVHQVRFGKMGKSVGIAYDESIVYVFGDLSAACRNLNIEPNSIDPHRRNARSIIDVTEGASVITLDEYVDEFNR